MELDFLPPASLSPLTLQMHTQHEHTDVPRNLKVQLAAQCSFKIKLVEEPPRKWQMNEVGKVAVVAERSPAPSEATFCVRTPGDAFTRPANLEFLPIVKFSAMR